jgi:hypothetical protein
MLHRITELDEALKQRLEAFRANVTQKRGNVGAMEASIRSLEAQKTGTETELRQATTAHGGLLHAVEVDFVLILKKCVC